MHACMYVCMYVCVYLCIRMSRVFYFTAPHPLHAHGGWGVNNTTWDLMDTQWVIHPTRAPPR